MQYSSYEGKLKFKNKEDFAEALKILDPWFDKKFLNDDSLFSNLVLEFPDMFQVGNIGKNIHRGLNTLVDSISTRGTIVGTSTDGCFDGWVVQDGRQIRYDQLDIWCKQHHPQIFSKYAEYDKAGDEGFDQKEELSNEICNLYYDKYL